MSAQHFMSQLLSYRTRLGFGEAKEKLISHLHSFSLFPLPYYFDLNPSIHCSQCSDAAAQSLSLSCCVYLVLVFPASYLKHMHLNVLLCMTPVLSQVFFLLSDVGSMQSPFLIPAAFTVWRVSWVYLLAIKWRYILWLAPLPPSSILSLYRETYEDIFLLKKCDLGDIIIVAGGVVGTKSEGTQ